MEKQQNIKTVYTKAKMEILIGGIDEKLTSWSEYFKETPNDGKYEEKEDFQLEQTDHEDEINRSDDDISDVITGL